jgi:Ca2+/Na+ antiporter
MNSIIKNKFNHFKNIILRKKVIYLIILLSSLFIISSLWINNKGDAQLKITLDECTIPKNGEDKCQYVKENCSDIEGLFNYLSFIYCTMSKYSCIAIIIMSLWIIWLFLLFGTSASSFFSPNLTVIANYLHLPESVAGVTLAALGNGAPDVFGTFSSFKANSGGLAIGELIGASLFVSILVIGSISLVSPVKVSRKPFICDMLFFIGAIVCVLILLIKRNISAFDSMMMLGYYIIYVISVVVINWRKHIKKSRIENYQSLGFHFPRCEFDSDSEEVYNDDADAEDSSSDFSESTISESINSLESKSNENKNSTFNNEILIVKNPKEKNYNNEIVSSPPSFNILSNKNKNKKIKSDDEYINEYDENTPLLNKDNNLSPNNEASQYLSSYVNINNYFENKNSTNNISTNSNTVRRNSKSFKDKVIHTLFPYFKDWHQQSSFSKCVNLFCMPFNLILTLTIPVITPEIHKAYGIQVKKEKEKTESTMHQRRRRHHHHRRHHRRHHKSEYSSEDLHKVNTVSGNKETEHLERLKKQQLSRILSENKNSLSRSTSFEEINSLVREGMMKKQKKLLQSEISKSFTNDNLYHLSKDNKEYPLKKSQSLNLIKMKKKYKSLSIYNPDDNLYQKALRNTSYLNSQKQKERESSMNFDTLNNVDINTNINIYNNITNNTYKNNTIINNNNNDINNNINNNNINNNNYNNNNNINNYHSFAVNSNLPSSKFINIDSFPKEKDSGVMFKEFSVSDSSYDSSPTSDYKSSQSPSKIQSRPPPEHFMPLTSNLTHSTSTSKLYPSPTPTTPPSNYNTFMNINTPIINMITDTNTNTTTNINTNINANINMNTNSNPINYSIINNYNNIYPINQNSPYPLTRDISMTNSSPPKNNTLMNRVMSVSSINNYDFNDINEYNSYFMETNNISMNPMEYSVNGSYYDISSIYSNSCADFSIYAQPSIDQDTITPQNTLSNSQGNPNDKSTSVNTTDEISFHIDGPIILSEVWNKWLIVIPTTICPLFITLICSIDLNIEYYHWLLSCCTSITVFLLTSICLKSDRIPTCYCIFSIIGFISGLCWIYVIANEVVAVLQSLGKILRISDSIMGLSFFAMGNSLGDLITNVSIARMGFSKMAIGACLGTPLLNIILGLGISGIILTEKNHKALPIKIDSNTLYFSVIGLLIGAIGTLFLVYINKFKMTRSYGLCAIIIYSLIVIMQVIIEINQ